MQQAREAARRSQCKNKLKQIGLALHNYHDTHSAFPPGGISHLAISKICSTDNVETNWGAPWTIHVLPFLEQTALYSQFDFQRAFTTGSNNPGSDVGNPSNRQLFFVSNPNYQCPSDPNSGSGSNNNNYLGVQGGGAISPAAESLAVCTTQSNRRVYFDNGTLYHGSSTRMRDLTDGSTNTLLIGESRYLIRPTARSDGFHLSWASADNLGSSARPGACAAAVESINSFQGHGGDHDTFNEYTRAFGSFHTGGCHFTLADGSVRFISENLDLRMLRFLAQRQSGAVIGEF